AGSVSNIPCKFFRNGKCQAGSQCVFSHLGPTDERCKYFLKGQCKFGRRCALMH
ncbi:MAG: hypothetical protein DHS80DRAFT_8182, partial [Piptocephalis tieghemiana]